MASHSYSVILTDISGNITTINQSFIKASSACSPETVPNSISSYGVYPSCTVISCQAGFAISSDKTSCVNGVFASITKTGTGFGQVSESFNRLNCGSDCSGYLPNENISFTASANNFSTFSGWSNLDSCSYLIPLTTPTCSFMNNGSFSATAQFSSKFSSGFVRGFDGYVHAIKPLANGQYVAVGAFNLYNGNRARGIAILNPDFSMDTSFNSTSATSELFLASYYYMDVAEDSNGRLIVVGFFGKLGPNTNYQNVARLNRDGSIDTTFSSIKFNQIMTKVNILPNKKILLTAGAFEGGYVGSRGSYDVNSNRMTTLNGSAYTNNQGILKLNENGTVDSSFSIAGVDSSVSTSSGISDVIILNDNEALIAGSVITTFNGTSVSNLLKIDLNTGAILKDYNRTELISSLMLDGNTLYVGHSVGIFKYSDYTTETIDSGFSVANFGMNGGFTMPFAYHKIVRKMIKNGNDLIVIGYYRISNSETNAYLMRFNATTGAMFANRTGYTTTGGPNGTKGITNTFTNSSQAGVPFSGFINNNNQLVIAGNFPIYRKISAGGLMVVDVSTLDPISTFPTRFHSYDTQGDMTMDASGNLYVFSKNMEDYNGDGLYSNYLLKINGTTGLPDTTFKFGNLYKYNPANTAYFLPGTITGQNNGSTAYKQTIFYNKYDNKLYLVGTDFLVQYNSKYYMGVVRINMDGSIDTSFLANMPLITGTSYGIKFPNDGSGFVSSVDADSTGVYIGGKFTGYGTTASANIMKINGGTSTPGTLISSFAGTGLTATTFVTAIKALGTIASGNDVANNNKIYVGLTSTNPTWNGTALPSAQQRSILRVTSSGVIDTSWTTAYFGNLINSMAYEPVSGNILLGTGYSTKRLNYLTNTGAVVTASLPILNNIINSVALVSDGTTSYFAIAGSFTTTKGGLARLSIDGLTLTTTANHSLYEDLYGATAAVGVINKIIPKFSGNGFYTINSSQIAIGSSFSYPFILDYNVNSTPPYIQLNK